MPKISGNIQFNGNNIDQREIDRTRDLRHAQTQLNFLRGLNQMGNIREFEEEMPAELEYYGAPAVTQTKVRNFDTTNCYIIGYNL